jgi:hypothetical protein
MYHKVEIDFGLNLIKAKSYTVENGTFRKKCHKYTLVKKVNNLPDAIQLEPEKILKVPWLFGPATELATRKIIYPCSRFKCSIPCPCMLCAQKHPTCRVPSSKPCCCHDCKTQFDDHSTFHAAFHHGCKYCYQLVKKIPNFNFFCLDTQKKIFPTGCFDSNYPSPYFCPPEHKVSVDFLQMWCRKREKWKNGQEDLQDMWCRGCNVLFWSFNDLRKHILKRHLNSKVFWHHCLNTAEREDCSTKCYQCSKKFVSVKELHRHIESIHFEDSHSCDVCEATFTREDNLIRHKRMKHRPITENLSLSCQECGKQFARFDSLKRHTSVIHSSSGTGTCDICLSKFDLEANLTIHVENMFNQDGTFKHYCHKCEEKFCTEALLKEHSQSSHGEIQDEKVFKCYLCPKQFSKEGNLKNHKEMIHKNNSFGLMCLKCNTKFKNKFCLERHQKEMQSGESPKYSCAECDMTFCTSKILRVHANFEHAITYACDYCEQTFQKKNNLDVHLKKRMEKPLSCQMCGKSFCNHLPLKTHIKTEHLSIVP